MYAGFLDFFIAVAAVVSILKSPAIIRRFLDLLIPGPSGPHSPFMEGLAHSLGWKTVNAGIGAIKAGAGLTTSAIGGGLAAAFGKGDAEMHMPKLGDALKNFQKGDGGYSPSGSNSGFGPSIEKASNDNTKLLASNLPIPVSNNTDSESPYEDSNSEEVTNDSFERSYSTNSSMNGTNSFYDTHSKTNGAYTSLSQSGFKKFVDIGEKTPKGNNMPMRFLKGATDTFKKDLGSRLTGQGKYGNKGRNAIGSVVNSFKDANQQQKEFNDLHDSVLPSEQMVSDAKKGDPVAVSSMGDIAEQQQVMHEAVDTIQKAEAIRMTYEPEYETYRNEYEQFNDQYQQMEMAERQLVSQMVEEGLSEDEIYQDDRYRHIQDQKSSVSIAMNDSERKMKDREMYVTQATDMRDRATKRMERAQEKIFSTNQSYANYRQDRGKSIEAAIARTGKRKFSDSGFMPW